MDICCLEECGEYSVRPMLVATKQDDCPRDYPCLPRCTKQIVYCCKEEKPKCCREPPKCYREPPKCHHETREPPKCRETCIYSLPPPPPRKCKEPYVCIPPPRCCEPECRPVKTKYIMPCYRYEDGRICNQPSKLMRRACEVAVGNRPRKKHCEPWRSPYADHSQLSFKEDDKHQDHCGHHLDHEPGVPCYKVGRYSSSPVFCVEHCHIKPRSCHDSYFS